MRTPSYQSCHFEKYNLNLFLTLIYIPGVHELNIILAHFTNYQLYCSPLKSILFLFKSFDGYYLFPLYKITIMLFYMKLLSVRCVVRKFCNQFLKILYCSLHFVIILIIYRLARTISAAFQQTVLLSILI